MLKPSELTPYTALRLAELAADVLPPGVLNVVCGQGETAGVALVAHPDVAMVSLTGSVAAGKAIAKASSETLKRVHLELGGKAPVVVFDDADAAAVAAGVRAAGYYNSGQDCTAACRVIAGPKVHDDLVAALQAEVSADPLRRPHRRRHRGRPGGVGRAARAGERDGVAGPRTPAPRCSPAPSAPTAAASSTPRRSSSGPAQDSEIVQREVFGPVVTVQRAPDEETLLAWANGVDYGLAASVWTTDVGRAMRMAAGPALRHRVGQRPHPDHERDAPRRLQAERLRQGHVDLRRRALHRAQARHDQALIPSLGSAPTPRLSSGVDDLDGALHAVGDVAGEVAGVDDRAGLGELVEGRGARSPGATLTSPGTGGWRRSVPLAWRAVHLGVADDQLVVDRVVVVHDELHDGALGDAEGADVEAALVDADLDRDDARGRAPRCSAPDAVHRVAGADGDQRAGGDRATAEADAAGRLMPGRRRAAVVAAEEAAAMTTATRPPATIGQTGSAGPGVCTGRASGDRHAGVGERREGAVASGEMARS